MSSNTMISRDRALAKDFYEQKLIVNPEMPKYNHSLAAIQAAGGNLGGANELYKAAMRSDPQNLMIKNDFALNLARQGHIDSSIDEFRRTLLINNEQPTLHKNISAVYARTGHYKEAHEHARRAVQINPNDPMSLRNLAKVKDTIGDSRSALPYYLKAIEIEKQRAPHNINTASYRAAAVQLIAQSGGSSVPSGTNSNGIKFDSHEEALKLVRAARAIDGVHYQSPTTERTNEILNNIRLRKGDVLDSLEKQTKRRQDAIRMKEEILQRGATKFPTNL